MCAASNDLNPVDTAVWGALQVMVWFTTAKVSTLCKNQKVQLSQRGNNCHKRFLAEISVNDGGVVLKT